MLVWFLLVNKFSLDDNQIFVMFDNFGNLILNMGQIYSNNLAKIKIVSA